MSYLWILLAIPFAISAVGWIACALLYVGQVSPVTFHLPNLGKGLPASEYSWLKG